MRLPIIICAVFAFGTAYAGPTEINDPDTLEYLHKVHNTLGIVSQAVTACADNGADPKDCMCEHEDLILEFQAAVTALLKAHPEISNFATVNYRDTNGGTIAQNIPALIRRAEISPNCS